MSALKRYLNAGHVRGLAILAVGLLFGCEAKIYRSDVPIWDIPPRPIVVLVADNDGDPVLDATVTLYKKTGLGAVAERAAQTDADGYATFAFEELHSAEYLLYARKTGFVGGSTFAIVDLANVMVGSIKLLPLSSLPDIAVTTIDPSGGGVGTQPTEELPQSTITFDSGAFSTPSEVTLGTLTGGQIPVVPEGLVALNAVMIESSVDPSGSATVGIGLPFDLPEGTLVPVTAFNELTGEWVEVASGTVTAGAVVASIGDIGTISALAGIVPLRGSTLKSPIGAPQVLDQNSDLIITNTYIPRLEFPQETDYTMQTETWLEGVIGSLVGVTFGEPVTVSVRRDPSKVQILELFSTTDRYVISVAIGEASGRPAGEARMGYLFDFLGDAIGQTTRLTDLTHNSGTGGGA